MIPKLKELLQPRSDDQKSELHAIKGTTEMNPIQEKDTLNCFEVSNSNAKALDIKTEPMKDPVLRKIFIWFLKGRNDNLAYASIKLRKHCKHLICLQLQKGNLVRQFFGNVRKTSD